MKWKSKIFKIDAIQERQHPLEFGVQDGYLDVKYDKDQLVNLFSCPSNSDIAFGITSVRFTDDFYMHRISKGCVAISLYGVSQIIEQKCISMENFILKQIYEICALSNIYPEIYSGSVYELIHGDTRGCLFDLNGNRLDIIANTERPKICDSCKAIFRRRQIDSGVIVRLERELKRLKKPLILAAELFIKKYPFISIMLTVATSIILNTASNFLYDKIK